MRYICFANDVVWRCHGLVIIPQSLRDSPLESKGPASFGSREVAAKPTEGAKKYQIVPSAHLTYSLFTLTFYFTAKPYKYAHAGGGRPPAV